MSPRRLASSALHLGLLLGPLLACGRGYLSVTVSAVTPGLAAQIVQLSVSAGDSTLDSGTLLPPSGQLDGGLAGLPDGSVVFTIEAPLGSNLFVVVEGLDSAGNAIAANGQGTTALTSSSHIAFQLQPSCSSDAQCDPNLFCQGLISCGPLGYCQTISGGKDLDAGVTCGPCAGSCDGSGVCVLADCGCLVALPDGGQGYVFDPDAGEQCDDGNGPDGGNLDAADHCHPDCRLPSCGDGFLDLDAGEICDLGASRNGTGVGCNATCNLLGNVSTLAGNPDDAGGFSDGIGAAASFDLPEGLAVQGGLLFVADSAYQAIRQIDPITGAVITLAGGNGSCQDLDGLGRAGTFCGVSALLAYDGGLLATDASALRFVSLTGDVMRWSGQLVLNGSPLPTATPGSFSNALYGAPQGIAALGGDIYTSCELGGLILQSDPRLGLVSITAELGGSDVLSGMVALNGVVYTSNANSPGSLFGLYGDGGAWTVDGTQTLASPEGVCTDGRSIYICEAGKNQIRQLDPTTGVLSLLAGNVSSSTEADGLGAQAGFDNPAGCAWDPARAVLYVSDKGGNTIRVIH